MKRGWKYVLIALATVVSCVDRSYGGMQEEEIFVDTTEPIPVKTYIGSAETILPKGSGVITDPREWDENSKFFIYAFNNNMFTSYRVTSKTDGYGKEGKNEEETIGAVVPRCGARSGGNARRVRKRHYRERWQRRKLRSRERVGKRFCRIATCRERRRPAGFVDR